MTIPKKEESFEDVKFRRFDSTPNPAPVKKKYIEKKIQSGEESKHEES
jgi:hypothetical protein